MFGKLFSGSATRDVNCSPPEGSKPKDPKNQYGMPQIPKKIPMPEVKLLKEDINILDLVEIEYTKRRIKRACDEANITYDQALAFLVSYYDIEEDEI